jgi:hypothetical protein
MAEMWEINEALAEKNRFKAFNKKHPRELAACFSNVGHIVDLLNRHGNVGAFQVDFFHSEGENVYRIGQTGVKYAVETRLYVYVYTVGPPCMSSPSATRRSRRTTFAAAKKS